MDKLVIAIVQDQDASILIEEVTKANFRVTKLSSSGGFLKQGNTTVILGIEEDRLDQLKEIFEDLSQDLDGDKEGIHVFYMAGDIGREF